jgi:hypothetical protein
MHAHRSTPTQPPTPTRSQGIDEWVRLMKGWPRVLELMVAGKLLPALLPGFLAAPLGRLLGRPFMRLASVTGNELLDTLTKVGRGGSLLEG